MTIKRISLKRYKIGEKYKMKYANKILLKLNIMINYKKRNKKQSEFVPTRKESNNSIYVFQMVILFLINMYNIRVIIRFWFVIKLL